jgi:carbonic anhydrase
MLRTTLSSLLAVLSSLCAIAQTHETASTPDPDKVLEELLAGNRRFAAAQLTHPHQTPQRRAEIAKGQHPVAIILSCSDSRIPPEVVFDQGLGDLFVIRLAGNIADDAAIGSIEYAAGHLGVRLMMVLGHKRCGAVEATVKGGEAPGHLRGLVEAIRPAVQAAKGQPGDLLDNAVRANVRQVAAKLRSTGPILSELVREKKLKVLGAYYDLDNGGVTLAP